MSSPHLVPVLDHSESCEFLAAHCFSEPDPECPRCAYRLEHDVWPKSTRRNEPR